MAHRREEYDANGHEVVLQQVNEYGEPSAWIDGWAVYDEAFDEVPVDTEDLDAWDALERLVTFMVDMDVLFCKSCNSFYDSDRIGRTKFAGHECVYCTNEARACDENPDGRSHDDECINPRQKHNARVATKYKCKHCGRVRKTTPTG